MDHVCVRLHKLKYADQEDDSCLGHRIVVEIASVQAVCERSHDHRAAGDKAHPVVVGEFELFIYVRRLEPPETVQPDVQQEVRHRERDAEHAGIVHAAYTCDEHQNDRALERGKHGVYGVPYISASFYVIRFFK